MPTCTISEEQLFSWIDRDAQELEDHLAACPECRAKSSELRTLLTEVAQSTPETAQQWPTHIGEYSILRLIGVGGQGWVFEAEQKTPRRRVALKVVKGGSGEDQDGKRLQREAQTLAHLKHPGIAAIYEAGRTNDGKQFFAMELVQGEPLMKYVGRQKLGIRQRLELFRKVCSALEYAHQRGIIHRDLKPSNILIESDHHPKIVDFGLARSTQVEVSHKTTLIDAGKIVGTLPYMSPEQARAEDMDIRGDVYSMGVILYQLLTDQLPFQLERMQPHAALRIICEQSVPSPSAANRQLAPELDIITLKALEKEPQQRYQRIADLEDDITLFMAGKPIMARRPTIAYRLKKLVWRNKLTAALIAAICLLSGGSALWISHLNTEAESLLRGFAAPITSQDIERFRQRYEQEDPNAAILRVSAAELLRTMREYDEAESICRRALGTLRKSEPDGLNTLQAQVVLGRILTDKSPKNEAGAAQPLLRGAIKTYQSLYPQRAEDLALARFALARCLMRLGIHTEAETLLQQSYAALSNAGVKNPNAREVLDALVEFYESTGKSDKASEYRQKRVSRGT